MAMLERLNLFSQTAVKNRIIIDKEMENFIVKIR